MSRCTDSAGERWRSGTGRQARGARATRYLDGASVAALQPSAVGQPTFRLQGRSGRGGERTGASRPVDADSRVHGRLQSRSRRWIRGAAHRPGRRRTRADRAAADSRRRGGPVLWRRGSGAPSRRDENSSAATPAASRRDDVAPLRRPDPRRAGPASRRGAHATVAGAPWWRRRPPDPSGFTRPGYAGFACQSNPGT